MTKSVPSSLVARHFLYISEYDCAREAPATPLHLLKWTFLAHGWAYACFDTQLVIDRVEAWKFGPVFPELYFLMKSYEGNTSTSIKNVPKNLYEAYPKRFKKNRLRIKLKKREKCLIEVIYEKYNKLSGLDLIMLTHKRGSPWQKTERDQEIDQDLIRSYYRGMAGT